MHFDGSLLKFIFGVHESNRGSGKGCSAKQAGKMNIECGYMQVEETKMSNTEVCRD